MITVKNNSRAVIGLPGGVYVQPGQSVEVDAGVLEDPAVKAWVGKGILLIIPTSAEQDDKDRLIAALAERGIERDRRYSVETLQALLGESNE